MRLKSHDMIGADKQGRAGAECGLHDSTHLEQGNQRLAFQAIFQGAV
jgi:hypothetical protein